LVTTNHEHDYHAYLIKAYDDHMKSLQGRARRLCNGRHHEAEDLVQETFLRTLIYPMNPEEIRNPRGYLLRVMHNLWVTKWGKEKRALTESLDAIIDNPARQKETPTVEPEIDRMAKNEDLLYQLKELQGALSGDERRLLAARLEGQTLEEIAEEANEDELRTKYRWHKLTAKLSRLIRIRNAKTKGGR
jgi:RNA polymerase sigma factor (sigma-70 family)